MAARRTRKRARSSSPSQTDPPPNPPVSDEYILSRLGILNSHAQRHLLLDAARNHPEILEAIETNAAPLQDAAVSKGRRLQDHAIPVYYLLHYFGDDPKMPGKYEAVRLRSVMASIEIAVDAIEERCPRDANFGTKRNALVALRQICEHIYTANTPVGGRLRLSLLDPSFIELVMIRIIKGMTIKERDLLKIQGPDENWLYETACLADETARQGLFCMLVDAVRMVGGPEYNVRDQENMKKNQSMAWRSRMRIGRELRARGDRMSGAPDVQDRPVPEWAT